jgi:hypothetical protein
VFLVSELEATSTAGVFQRRRAIDEKHGVIAIVFLTQFREEAVCENLGSGRFEPLVQQFVVSGSTAAYSQ